MWNRSGIRSKSESSFQMRYELKYVLTPIQYALLQGRLKWILRPDEHAGENGEYFIRSVYFDSPDKKALREKQSGVDKRKKYRIRFYNGNAGDCRLECKEKTGTRIRKRSQQLTREQTQALLAGTRGEDLEEAWNEAWNEAAYADSLLRDLRFCIGSGGFVPVVTVDYVREAYVLPLSELRVTFDKEIAWGPVEGCLTRERYLSNTYVGSVVLEVKYNEYLPEHVSAILSCVRPVQTAVSKYVACVEAQYAARGY